jgi:hypothetical protein
MAAASPSRRSSEGFRGSIRHGALFVSLALNIALAFYIAIPLAISEPEAIPRDALAIPEIFAFSEERLPARDIGILKDAYRPAEPYILARQADAARALARAIMSLGDSALDMNALRASIAEARQKKAQLDDLVVETFLNAVEHFSADGRRKLVSQYKLRR